MKKSLLLSYSTLSLPLAFVSMPLYIYAPDFYAVPNYISLAMIGVILLFIRLFDAVQDPLIGVFLDRYPKYHMHALAVGTALMGAGFYMIFHPIEPYILWFSASMILCTLGLSIISILFHSLGGLWHTENTHQKTLITSWREGLGLIAVLSVVTLPLYMSFTEMFYVLCAVSIIAIFCFWRWHEKAVFIEPKTEQKPSSFKSILNQKWSRIFYGIFLISHIANAIPGVLVIFFIRDYLREEDLAGLFLILYFISGALAMGIWQKIAKHYGKLKCWLLSMIVAAVSFIWILWLNPHDIYAYGMICILSGSAVGADLTLPSSVLADYTQKDPQNTARYFSIMALIPKISLAFASVIAFQILDIGGYDAGGGANGGDVTLLLVYGLVPCIIKTAAILLTLYAVQKKTLKEIL